MKRVRSWSVFWALQVWWVVATSTGDEASDETTKGAAVVPPPSHLRKLQQSSSYRTTDHRAYVYICRRRGWGNYELSHVLEYEESRIIAEGGGRLGERVPYMDGFIFGDNCLPSRLYGSASCPTDTKTCSNGRTVERDPDNNCSFFPCPRASCCQANERPQCNHFFQGPQCCPTGSWACPNLFGSYYCGSDLGNIRRDFGPVCAGFAAAPQSLPNPTPPPPPPTSALSYEPAFSCSRCECGCTTGYGQEPRCNVCNPPPPPPPPPAPTISCDICACGFFDGCNECACNSDGTTFCTLRACGANELRQPKCNDCRPPPPPPPPPPAPARISCDTCPCGYYDGCNECGCDANGNGGFCSRMFCDVYDTAYCKPCSAVEELRLPAACDGGYKRCPDLKWVALDPSTGCTRFFPCD